LKAQAPGKAVYQFLDGGGLIAGGLKWRNEFEFCHISTK
jgi:hypothetical protein